MTLSLVAGAEGESAAAGGAAARSVPIAGTRIRSSVRAPIIESEKLCAPGGLSFFRPITPRLYVRRREIVKGMRAASRLRWSLVPYRSTRARSWPRVQSGRGRADDLYGHTGPGMGEPDLPGMEEIPRPAGSC